MPPKLRPRIIDKKKLREQQRLQKFLNISKPNIPPTAPAPAPAPAPVQEPQRTIFDNNLSLQLQSQKLEIANKNIEIDRLHKIITEIQEQHNKELDKIRSNFQYQLEMYQKMMELTLRTSNLIN